MKILPKPLIVCVLLLSSLNMYAQQDTTTDVEPPPRSYFKAGISFLNNNVFLGRTDTVNTPMLSAKLGYTFKWGLYLSGSVDMITNRNKNKLDGGDVEIGYNYTQDDNLEWGVSFTKMFFNSTSTQVSSSLSSEINAFIDYDVAGVITPSLSLSYSIGKNGNKGDLLLNPSLSHDFLIESIFNDDDRVLISPQAGLNIGSQNFYSSYLERKGKIARRANAVYFNALGDIKVLDYEITAPIVYILGKFRFSFVPTYAFAQDSLPKSTAAEQIQSAVIETSQPFKSSVFYFDAGVSFKF